MLFCFFELAGQRKKKRPWKNFHPKNHKKKRVERKNDCKKLQMMTRRIGGLENEWDRKAGLRERGREKRANRMGAQTARREWNILEP